jgi:hypothetical protein
MARGKKTSPEVIYQVMASWAITNNYNETAKALGMAVSSVKKIVVDNKDKDEFAKLCDEKRDEFAETATRIINQALNRLEREIADDEKEIPINHLTTAIGTLYDKRALAKGESTGNTKITFDLPQGVDEFAE